LARDRATRHRSCRQHAPTHENIGAGGEPLIVGVEVGERGEVRLVGDTRGLAPLGTSAQCNSFEVAVVNERVDHGIEVTTDLGVAVTLEIGEHRFIAVLSRSPVGIIRI
jgi:hypothetical protein